MRPEPYYSDGLVTLYHGDCEDVLPLLGGVDLVFTSPPYNLGTNPGGVFGHWKDGGSRGGMGKWNPGGDTSVVVDYEGGADDLPYDEYRAQQKAVLAALWRTLSDVGAIFYNHKPRVQRAGLLTPFDLVPEGTTVRQVITWDRGSGPNFTPTAYQPRSEWILVLARDGWRLTGAGASGVGDVWRVPAENGTTHPAPFPLALPARAIETTGPRLVLDPYAGSGTTLLAARSAGVKSIGIERSERYCEMAAARVGSWRHSVVGDGSLFGTAS